MIEPSYPDLVNRVSTFRDYKVRIRGMSLTLVRHAPAIRQNKFAVHVLRGLL